PHCGHAGTVTRDPAEGIVFETEYADARQIVSWVLGLGDRARILDPPELVEDANERVQLVVERHSNPPELARKSRRARVDADGGGGADANGKRETPIRP